ncbi:MAG: spore coat protein [Clostridiales bacterium]|jgi:spore coat protein CotF|nr:spore coat protein [Clostridiales bacterium]
MRRCLAVNINLTAKERTLLEDQKSHEEICIQKYSNYASMASDAQLKEMFKNHANIEQQHLNTINQLLSGQMPGVGGMQSGGGGASQPNQSLANYQSQGSFNANRASDKDLCTDMLMTEKYVSGTYDTAIFEFKDPKVRDVLSHIQREEQKHGEAIFKYMESKGMYTPQ